MEETTIMVKTSMAMYYFNNDAKPWAFRSQEMHFSVENPTVAVCRYGSSERKNKLEERGITRERLN